MSIDNLGRVAAMPIDGHVVRISAIDAVTLIEVSLEGVDEGTDKIARGKFHVYVRGQRITIFRNKRCGSDKIAGRLAVEHVRFELDALREPIVQSLMRGW